MPKVAARVRVLSVGHGRKSDPDDAISVAVAARAQTINRLHRLLLDLVPGGTWRNLTANRAAAHRAGRGPHHGRSRPGHSSLLGLVGVGPVLAARLLGPSRPA